MSDLRKAAQQALEALKTSGCVAFTGSACHCNSTCSSYTAAVILRDALAQEPEPVNVAGLSIAAQSTIGRWLNEDMDRAVANGANSISMPDELVEIAAWLHALAALAQQHEPAQELVAWLVKWANAYDGEAYTEWQKGYDAARSVVKAHLPVSHTQSHEPKQPESAQEPGQDLIPPDSLFVCGQMGAHVTRVRLAEPAQEPVAWGWVGDPSTQDYAATQPDPVAPVAWNWMLDGRPYGQAYYGNPPDADIVERAAISGRTVRLLYTAPPQRPPLTDEEIAEATAGVLGLPHEIKVELARAVERKVRGE